MEGCEKRHLSRDFFATYYAQWGRGSIGMDGLGNLELTRVGEHLPGHVVDLEEAIHFLEQHVHYGMLGEGVLYDRLSVLMG